MLGNREGVAMRIGIRIVLVLAGVIVALAAVGMIGAETGCPRT
jgi:hypothetical protein